MEQLRLSTQGYEIRATVYIDNHTVVTGTLNTRDLEPACSLHIFRAYMLTQTALQSVRHALVAAVGTPAVVDEAFAHVLDTAIAA